MLTTIVNRTGFAPEQYMYIVQYNDESLYE